MFGTMSKNLEEQSGLALERQNRKSATGETIEQTPVAFSESGVLIEYSVERYKSPFTCYFG